MPQYLTLLRGINVGGNNIIKMVDLKACFETLGFSNVRTYIQSGNVLFQSEESSLEKLSLQIETTLSKQFDYKATIVIISQAQLQQVVASAPEHFGKEPDQYRYDFIFVKPPLTATEALAQLTTNPGIDTAHAGEHALYFSRLISKAPHSHLAKIIKLPLYKSITIRNWNTTTKLLALMH